MLSQKDYAKFNLKMTSTLKDCYIKEPTQNMSALVFNGNTTQTKDNVYYYNEESAKNHREDLISLCISLPRLDNIILGTARNYSIIKLNLWY